MTDQFRSTVEDFWRVYGDAAEREGWNIFDCDGSDFGRWQIQDCRDQVEGGSVQPHSDNDAWALVLASTLPHHYAAIDIIRRANPGEWQMFCEVVVNDQLKIPEDRLPLVVAALLQR